MGVVLVPFTRGHYPMIVTVNGENVPIGQFIKRSQNLFKRMSAEGH